LVLIINFAACGTPRKTIHQSDLSEYNGFWLGDDYGRFPNEAGDTISIGSTLTMDMVNKSIMVQHIGPPFMSRIAQVNTSFEISDSGAGRFKFDDDGWGNRGSGRIEFKDYEIVVEIKIEERANADMQIFEGRISFMKEEPASETDRGPK
jgi:hypothetical protein